VRSRIVGESEITSVRASLGEQWTKVSGTATSGVPAKDGARHDAQTVEMSLAVSSHERKKARQAAAVQVLYPRELRNSNHNFPDLRKPIPGP
jgi:hypothetical protein